MAVNPQQIIVQQMQQQYQQLLQQGQATAQELATFRSALRDAQRDVLLMSGGNPNGAQGYLGQLNAMRNVNRYVPTVAAPLGQNLAQVSPLGGQIVNQVQSRIGQNASSEQLRAEREALSVAQRRLEIDRQRLQLQGQLTTSQNAQYNAAQRDIAQMQRGLEMQQRQIRGSRPQLDLTTSENLQNWWDRGNPGRAMPGGLRAAGMVMDSPVGAVMMGARAAGGAIGGAIGRGIGMLPGVNQDRAGQLGQIIGMGASQPGVGLLFAAGSAVISQLGPATRQRAAIDALARRTGDSFPSNEAMYTSILGVGRENEASRLGFTRDQSIQMAQLLTSGGITASNPLSQQRMDRAFTYSRGMGIAPEEIGGYIASMQRVGQGTGDTGQERLLTILGNMVEQGGMRGRESEVIESVQRLTQTVAARGVTPESGRLEALLTILNQNAPASMRGALGANVLGSVDANLRGATGFQQAFMYNIARQANPGLTQTGFIYDQEQGITSPNAPRYIGAILNQAGGNLDQAGVMGSRFFKGTTATQFRELARLYQNGQLTPDAITGVMGSQAQGGMGQIAEGQLGQGERGERQLNRAFNTLQDAASEVLPIVTALGEAFGGLAMNMREGAGPLIGAIKGINISGLIPPGLPSPQDVAGAVGGVASAAGSAASGAAAAAGGAVGGAASAIGGAITYEVPGSHTSHSMLPSPPDIAAGVSAIGGAISQLPGMLPPFLSPSAVVRGRTNIRNVSTGLAALGRVGLGGIGRRLSDLTGGGGWTAAASQNLAEDPSIMVPQRGQDSDSYIEAFVATFGEDALENPPDVNALIGFTNWWIEQHQDKLNAVQEYQSNLQNLAEHWKRSGARYDQGDPSRGTGHWASALNSATDCSGFVSILLKTQGVSLPGNPNTTMFREGTGGVRGTTVNLADARVGDVVVSTRNASDPGNGEHMGIIVAPGRVAHMNAGTNGVAYDTLSHFVSSNALEGGRGRGETAVIRRLPGTERFSTPGQPAINLQQALEQMSALGNVPTDPNPVRSAAEGAASAIGGAISGAIGGGIPRVGGIPSGLQGHLGDIARAAQESGLPLDLFLATASIEDPSGGLLQQSNYRPYPGGPREESYGLYQMNRRGELTGHPRWFSNETDPRFNSAYNQSMAFAEYAGPQWQRVQAAAARGEQSINGLPIGTHAEQIAAAAALAEKPAEKYRGQYLNPAQQIQIGEPESYVNGPMIGAPAAAAANLQQMQISFQPATVTLQLPDGTAVGQAILTPTEDTMNALDMQPRSPYAGVTI